MKSLLRWLLSRFDVDFEVRLIDTRTVSLMISLQDVVVLQRTIMLWKSIE